MAGAGRALSTLVFLALFGACGPVKRPDGGSGLLPVGAPAPDFEGRDGAGKIVRLSDVRGHPAIVYFYPKDETPGCTHEACAFRDAFSRFEARKVTVFGVSHDGADSHEAFRAHYALPFPLVADEDGNVDRAYGVPTMLGMSKRVILFSLRPTGRCPTFGPMSIQHCMPTKCSRH